MTKQVVQFRICDRHTDREVPAVVTEKLSLNGARWELDLCQECSDALYAVVNDWGDLGTSVGSGSIFDQQRKITGPVVVDLDPKRKPAPERVVLSSEDIVEPTPPIVRDEPLHPPTASRWSITNHAAMRIVERDLDEHAVLTAAERPDYVLPSKTDVDLRLHTKGDLTAVVNPHTDEIITAFLTASVEAYTASGAR